VLLTSAIAFAIADRGDAHSPALWFIRHHLQACLEAPESHYTVEPEDRVAAEQILLFVKDISQALSIICDGKELDDARQRHNNEPRRRVRGNGGRRSRGNGQAAAVQAEVQATVAEGTLS
jgi:hypothetical protein